MKSTRNEMSEPDYRQPQTTEELLGIFLKWPDQFADYKTLLAANMFGEYKWLFESMIELDEQESLGFKPIVLRNPLHTVELRNLHQSAYGPSRIPSLIQKLKEEHLSNNIVEVTKRSAFQIIDDKRNPNEVLAELQKNVQNLNHTESTEMSNPDQDVDEFFDYMDEIIADPSKAYGLLTGLKPIDQLTTGYHRGDFIVIGARTSIGKSAFIIDTVLRIMMNGGHTAIYSLEMSKRQIYLRMLANLMSVDLNVLKTGYLMNHQVPEMKAKKDLLRKIYIDDKRGVSADYIVDSMRRVKRDRGLDFAVIDYIQEVKEIGESNDNGGSAIGRICRKLRTGAKEHDCAVAALSQVNRGVEERKDKRPMVSDLTGSAGIEASADVIAMLYRDEYYNPSTDDKNIMEINFAKQRNGEVGMVRMYNDRRFQQIRPI